MNKLSVVPAIGLMMWCILPDVAASQSTKETVYIAATPQTIRLETENAMGRSLGRLAYVRNESSVPIIVTSIEVKDCINVKQYCGLQKKNIKVGPGQRREILRLEPAVLTKSINYRFLYQWRPDGATKAALGALADAGDSTSAQRLADITRFEDRRRADTLYKDKNDKELYANELRSLGNTISALRAEPATIEMTVGSMMFVPQLRMLALDSTGRVLGRVRGSLSWQIPRNASTVFARPDTLRAVAIGTTEITMGLATQNLDGILPHVTPVVFTIVVK